MKVETLYELYMKNKDSSFFKIEVRKENNENKIIIVPFEESKNMTVKTFTFDIDRFITYHTLIIYV